MAGLNIGNINFGVEANTEKLQKAIADLGKFRQRINAVAKSQKEGATQTTNAMAKQESAIKKAIQATLNFQKAVNSSKQSDNAKREAIRKQERALTRLTKELTSGKLSVLEYTRSMDAFSARMGKSRRALNNFNKTVEGGKKGLKDMSVILRDLESLAVLALGPLSGLGARIRSVGAIIGRGKGGFAAVTLIAIGTAVAFSIALIKIATSAVKARSEMQALNMRFMAATGSLAAGKKEYEFTLKLAKSLGLEIGVLAKAYSRFLAASMGTALEGARTQKIFTQVAKAAAALKLEATDVEGIMRALEQMMSKGTVQAEELRGQLGDRLPGAFRFAAEAMGVTTRELNKMLKAGEVMAVELLPKLGDVLEEKLGKHAARNVDTISGSTANLKTALFELSLTADKLPGQLIDIFIPGEIAEDAVTFSGLLKGIIVDATRLANWLNALGTEEADLGDDTKRLSHIFRIMAKQWDDSGESTSVVTDGLEEMRAKQEGVILSTSGITDGFEHLRVKAEEVKDPIKDLTGSFDKLDKILEESLTDLTNSGKVLEHLKLGKIDVSNIGFLEKLLELLPIVEKLTPDGLEEMAKRLSQVLGMNVAATFEDVAKALAEVDARFNDNTDDIKAFEKGVEDLETALTTLAEMRERFAALSLGPEEAAEYDNITSKANAYRESLEGTNKTMLEREQMVATFTTILRENLRMEGEQEEAARAAAKAAREKAAAEAKGLKDLAKAQLTLVNLRERFAALSLGAKEAKEFDGITAKANAYRESLEGTNKTMLEREQMVATFIALMRENIRMEEEQDAAAKAATAAQRKRDAAKLKSQKAFVAAELTLANLRERLAAFQKGPEEAKFYDDIQAKAKKFVETMSDETTTAEQRNKMMEEYIELMKAIGILKDEQDQAAADEKKAASDLKRSIEKASEAVRRANAELATMKERLAALASGPDSLEIFERILEPLAKYEEKLIRQDVLINERTRLLKEYEAVLLKEFELTNRMARAGQAMGDAIGNAFDTLVTQGGSVVDIMRELLLELTKIWFRAMVIANMQSGLGSALGGLFGSVATPAASVGGIGGPGSILDGTFTPVGSSTGSTTKLGGSGGRDTIPFMGFGKAGEVVTVTRPDQRGGGGSGVVINQTNNFDNSGGSPETLGPILEENNRRLIGQIRDMQSRGEI